MDARARPVDTWGVPAGLDGNPEPITTRARTEVLSRVVELIGQIDGPRSSVGIDGASGTGKSTFADELAVRLAARGDHVVRSTTDSFHRPRAERMRRGPTSPVGYYRDSHDLDAIVAELLLPFAEGRSTVRVAAFDEPTDSPVEGLAEDIPAEAVLVFDGLFLLRPELSDHWDLVVHLTADDRREADWHAYLHGDLPADPTQRDAEIAARLERARWPRYAEGWQLYLDEVAPLDRATVVVDNDDLGAPVIRGLR